MIREFLIAMSLCFLVFVSAANAEGVAENIANQLVRMGYNKVTISRTLLGRHRIVATGPNKKREIIVNPRTGEILRDFQVITGSRPGSQSDLLSGERHRSDDDDHDDDKDNDDDKDDDDRDRDNSGRGNSDDDGDDGDHGDDDGDSSGSGSDGDSDGDGDSGGGDSSGSGGGGSSGSGGGGDD